MLPPALAKLSNQLVDTAYLLYAITTTAYKGCTQISLGVWQFERLVVVESQSLGVSEKSLTLIYLLDNLPIH